MVQKQKQIMALVLGAVLAIPLLASAGVRLVTTPAGCHANFKRGSLYNACMSCIKSRHKYKMDIHNAWLCK